MEIRQAIEDFNARFVEAFNRGDAAACADSFGLTVLPPNQQTVRGRQAIEVLCKDMIEEVGGNASVNIVEVGSDGDLAYQVATYAFDGGPISDVGKFVEIFKRQADGSWKLHVTIFNSDKPPPEQ